jgi:hypothetical protein
MSNLSSLPRPKVTSVVSQWELLKQATKDPSSVPEELRNEFMAALQSQASLAAFKAPAKDIVGMSLNTHKAIADECIEGGYAALNDYRKAALRRLKESQAQAEKPGRGTLDWYKDELAEKTEKLSRLTNDVATMGQKLNEVLALAHRMAQAANKEAEFNKLRSEIIRKFPS